MPARRLYASRGVPRRITTRRAAGSTRSFTGALALIAMLLAGGGGLLWLFNPWAPKPPPPVAAQPASGAAQTRGQAAFAPVLPNTDPAAAPPAAVNVSALGTPDPLQPKPATPMPAPTLRRWDTAATGLTIDPDLVARLDQVLAGVDGHLSVAVKDLGSGRGAALDGDGELPAASLYKLPVLDAVFAAGLSMYEELPITDEARSFDSGTMELGVGETLQVSEALERMITLSDNTSAI